MRLKINIKCPFGFFSVKYITENLCNHLNKHHPYNMKSSCYRLAASALIKEPSAKWIIFLGPKGHSNCVNHAITVDAHDRIVSGGDAVGPSGGEFINNVYYAGPAKLYVDTRMTKAELLNICEQE